MPITLYDATIPSFLQILGTMSGLLDKAQAFCAGRGISADEIIQARLAEDMLAFGYQVKSTAVHSLGAIEGVRKGLFSPDLTPPPADFAGLSERVAQTIAALRMIEPDEMESFIGRDMRFEIGDRRLDFRAEDFLLSFAQPNFYFHATTAYDILRQKGVPLGKRDFLGKMRLKI
jgi:hypothetical protein